ncbi:hypothetical protein C1646_9904 [Rhizophagus diaphanus]|nr:hypothetical protein C1646_9904 [Rhizophagus diaphanus] [Rhizophagus sp. MUCL 43196]
MKRILRSSLKKRNIDKEQIINSNPLKKQKLMITKTSISSPPQYTPQTSDNNNDAFSDVLTVDTPRSDDTNTLHSDTSDSDTITEDDDVLDKEIAIRDQLIKEREQVKTNETVNKIINGQVRLIETSLTEHEEIINRNNIVKSKDKEKIVEVKKDELKILQNIVVDTEDKSLSISLNTSEIKCHSFTVKSNVQMIKISPKLAICSASFKPRIIIHHQGRLINQHNYTGIFNNPCIILLRNGLNYVEILVKKSMDDLFDHGDVTNEDSDPGQKYLLFIRKL